MSGTANTHPRVFLDSNSTNIISHQSTFVVFFGLYGWNFSRFYKVLRGGPKEDKSSEPPAAAKKVGSKCFKHVVFFQFSVV